MPMTVFEASMWILVGMFLGTAPIVVLGIRDARRAARRPPPAPVDQAELRRVAGELERLSAAVCALAAAEAPDDRARATA